MWLTKELFVFIPQCDETGAIASYQLSLGTKKFPVGVIPYMAHRPHSVPSSFHIAGHWWLSFAAEDDTVGMAEKTADATMKQIAEDLRHLSSEQLAERTLGGDRGIAKPLMTSDSQIFDLQPIHKTRIQKERQRRKKWQKIAAKRRKGSKNQQKAYRKAARYQPYEKHVRHEYAHQTSHQLVAHDSRDLYVFEDLKIPNMTKRPKAKRDAHGRFLPNGRQAKAGLNRAILVSAWGQVVLFTTYKALRNQKLVITVPFAYSSQECAVCTFTSPDNWKNQAEFVCQRCGHRDNADHNAALRDCETRDHKTFVRRTAHENSQDHADFSDTRAGTIRSHAWGDRHKTCEAKGSHAYVTEPGTSEGDLGNPPPRPRKGQAEEEFIQSFRVKSMELG